MTKWVKKWQVRGRSGAIWIVAQDVNGNFGCSCPRWKFHREQCHHIDEIIESLDRGIKTTGIISVEDVSDKGDDFNPFMLRYQMIAKSKENAKKEKSDEVKEKPARKKRVQRKTVKKSEAKRVFLAGTQLRAHLSVKDMRVFDEGAKAVGYLETLKKELHNCVEYKIYEMDLNGEGPRLRKDLTEEMNIMR